MLKFFAFLFILCHYHTNILVLPPDNYQQIIKSLDDDDFQVREEAMNKLIKLDNAFIALTCEKINKDNKNTEEMRLRCGQVAESYCNIHEEMPPIWDLADEKRFPFGWLVYNLPATEETLSATRIFTCDIGMIYFFDSVKRYKYKCKEDDYSFFEWSLSRETTKELIRNLRMYGVSREDCISLIKEMKKLRSDNKDKNYYLTDEKGRYYPAPYKFIYPVLNNP